MPVFNWLFDDRAFISPWQGPYLVFCSSVIKIIICDVMMLPGPPPCVDDLLELCFYMMNKALLGFNDMFVRIHQNSELSSFS